MPESRDKTVHWVTAKVRVAAAPACRIVPRSRRREPKNASTRCWCSYSVRQVVCSATAGRVCARSTKSSLRTVTVSQPRQPIRRGVVLSTSDYREDGGRRVMNRPRILRLKSQPAASRAAAHGALRYSITPAA